jgi:hypothetical protein
MEVSGELQDPAALSAGERVPGTHWIGSWVSPKVCLDAVEKRKIFHFLESTPGRPASSPSLYGVGYPDCPVIIIILLIIIIIILKLRSP